MHDLIVERAAVSIFRAGGSAISADLPGWTQPPLISNMRPDITAMIDRRPIVVEVETRESWQTEHSLQQVAVFSEFAKKNGGEFHLLVPSAVRTYAKLLFALMAYDVSVNGY